MPSFTSSAVPTSRTSISARSAAWISLRRISLSSPGLRMESVAMGSGLEDCESYHKSAEYHKNAEFGMRNRWGGSIPDGGPSVGRLHGIEPPQRSEEHTSELQSRLHLVCRLLLEK